MSWRSRLIPLACLLAWSASASADPRIYQIQTLNQSIVGVSVNGDIQVTYSPLLGPPVSYSLSGNTNLVGRPSGSGVADVGLPGSFAGGAQGLLLSAFEANTAFAEGAILLTDIFGLLPPIETPIPLEGAAFVADIADLVVILDGPLSSPLTSVSDPDEYLWAGEAPITIAGSLNLSVAIPGQEPIGLAEPVDFSVSLVRVDGTGVNGGALFGSFTGDAATTTLVVGLDPVDVDPDTSEFLQPIPIDLGVLGSITVTPTRLRLIVNASYTGLNRQGGLPPATAAPGCGIGPELAALMPALGWLWRRRRRSS
jgi:hypothetical protein